MATKVRRSNGKATHPTPAKKTTRRPNRGNPRGNFPNANMGNRYPGLRDKIIQILTKGGLLAKANIALRVQKTMPEAAMSAISYHLYQLIDRDVVSYDKKTKAYTLNQDHVVADTPAPLAVPEAPKPRSTRIAKPVHLPPAHPQGPVSEEYLSRHMFSLALRMENFNAVSGVQMFPQSHIDTLRRRIAK